jgi:iron complex transport system substrate-binding protein
MKGRGISGSATVCGGNCDCAGRAGAGWRALWTLLAALLLLTPAWANRVLEDDAGHKVSLPDRPQRVICLSPSITQTVYALGAAGQVAGITDFTDYPPQALREKPSVGELLHPSLEKIVALHPDLAIALASMNSADTLRALERVGIPVFLVTAHGIAGIYHDTELLGRVLGREAQAAALLDQMHRREQAVRVRARGRRPPSVFLVLAMEPCITAGHNAFISEMIEAAGARSISTAIPQEWTRYSLETVLQQQPDYLLILRGVPFGLRDMQQHPVWRKLRAVQQGHVIVIDDRLQVPAPIAFDGLEDFSRQLQAQSR